MKIWLVVVQNWDGIQNLVSAHKTKKEAERERDRRIINDQQGIEWLSGSFVIKDVDLHD